MTLTGFSDLDQLTGGFTEGDLVVLASAPYMGTTSLALSIAANVIRREPEPIYGTGIGIREVRRAVALFTLQSSREQVVQRMLSLVGHIPVHDLSSGKVRGEDWPKLVRTVAEVSRAPLFLNDSADLSLREMRIALQETRRGLRGTNVELGLVIIDHFRLMLPPIRSEADQEDQAASILRGLKILARDIHLPVLLVAKLPQGLERRYDRRPLLSDFERSEPMDQFADMVMFLYRDEYYNPDSDDKGIAEIIIGKHRNGPTGKVQLAFLQSYGRFASLARR